MTYNLIFFFTIYFCRKFNLHIYYLYINSNEIVIKLLFILHLNTVYSKHVCVLMDKLMKIAQNIAQSNAIEKSVLKLLRSTLY